MSGLQLIAAERLRQIEVEGYEPEHDSGHTDEALAIAAACYAMPATLRKPRLTGVLVPAAWPWAARYWKPTPEDRVRELVKAGALIVAEIDRLEALGVSGD